MPPNPVPNNASVAAIQTDIAEDLNVTLSRNVSINNNHSSGFDIKSLPFNTKSVVNAGALNISTTAGLSKLTVDYNGNMNSAGYLTAQGDITSVAAVNSTSLFVYQTGPTDASSTFSVSSAGKITASDDLSIASNFKVTAVTGDIKSGAIASGKIDVTGGITTTTDININSSKIVLGNDGAITAVGDLKINVKNLTSGATETKFQVTASTGDVSTQGSITAAGNFKITNGTTDWFKIDAATGNTTIKGTTSGTGDLSINGEYFKVTASTGDVKLKGELNVNDNFSVDSNGVVTTIGDFTIANGPTGSVTEWFKVDSTNGNTVIAGTTSGTGDLTINGDKFKVTAEHGDVKLMGELNVNDKFKVDKEYGFATSEVPVANYLANDSWINESTTEISGTEPVFGSTTNNYLTTQEYVDKAIFKQTKRINTMLGSDETVKSFNNVLKVVTAIAGSGSAADALSGLTTNYETLVDKQEEVKTSLSKALEQAYNTQLVACLPTVWADETMPMPIPSPALSGMYDQVTNQTERIDGWFFENLVETGVNKTNKVNWYLPVNKDMTVEDIKNMYLNAFIGSNQSLPIITIYTAPKGASNSNYYPGFAGSRINFLFSNANPSATYNKTCCLYTGSSPMNLYDAVPTPVWKITTDDGTSSNSAPAEDSINLNRVSLTDKVAYIVIQSASTAAKSNVKFIANSFNIALTTGTVQFTFSNSGPSTNFLFMRANKMHSDMSVVLDKNIDQFKAYETAYLKPNFAAINSGSYSNKWA